MSRVYLGGVVELAAEETEKPRLLNLETAVQEGPNARKEQLHRVGKAHGQDSRGSPSGWGWDGLDRALGLVAGPDKCGWHGPWAEGCAARAGETRSPFAAHGDRPRAPTGRHDVSPGQRLGLRATQQARQP